MTTLEIIHDGHRLSRAFNSQHGLPITVLYCTDCSGQFHGCYCEVDGCLNCEVLEVLEI